jgi:hypothetical protein
LGEIEEILSDLSDQCLEFDADVFYSISRFIKWFRQGPSREIEVRGGVKNLHNRVRQRRHRRLLNFPTNTELLCIYEDDDDNNEFLNQVASQEANLSRSSESALKRHASDNDNCITESHLPDNLGFIQGTDLSEEIGESGELDDFDDFDDFDALDGAEPRRNYDKKPAARKNDKKDLFRSNFIPDNVRQLIEELRSKLAAKLGKVLTDEQVLVLSLNYLKDRLRNQ